MAHFAELESKIDPTGFTTDTHQIVKRVVVVGNDIPAGGGTLGDNDMHVDGETWCINFFKSGSWKQTSYNSNFRKQYAGKGMIYDSAKDKFISKQPYASWSLDASDDWQAPVTFPTITTYDSGNKSYAISWDEDNLRWTAKDEGVWNASTNSFDTEPQNFNWDASALAWVSA